MNRISEAIEAIRSRLTYKQPLYVPGYEYSPWKKWVIISLFVLLPLLLLAHLVANNRSHVYSGNALKDPVTNAQTASHSSNATPQSSTTSGSQAIQNSNTIVKMSNAGICHSPGDAYYDRTIHYTAYSSMQACIDAGGRPSER